MQNLKELFNNELLNIKSKEFTKIGNINLNIKDVDNIKIIGNIRDNINEMRKKSYKSRGCKDLDKKISFNGNLGEYAFEKFLFEIRTKEEINNKKSEISTFWNNPSMFNLNEEADFYLKDNINNKIIRLDIKSTDNDKININHFTFEYQKEKKIDCLVFCLIKKEIKNIDDFDYEFYKCDFYAISLKHFIDNCVFIKVEEKDRARFSDHYSINVNKLIKNKIEKLFKEEKCEEKQIKKISEINLQAILA